VILFGLQGGVVVAMKAHQAVEGGRRVGGKRTCTRPTTAVVTGTRSYRHLSPNHMAADAAFLAENLNNPVLKMLKFK
jgi:hypothetical protein